jgi:radical SAM protein with 4Fe4S-binding SPASM domain
MNFENLMGVNKDHLKAVWAFERKKDIANYKPLKVYIEPNNGCNLSCKFCANPRMKRKLGFMKMEVFDKLLEDSGEFINEAYMFHSGESLMHPKLGVMIRKLSDRGIKSVLFTNATFLTPEKTQKLVDAGLSILSVSYHLPKIHDNVKQAAEIVKGTKTKFIIQTVSGWEDKPEGFDNIIVRELMSYAGTVDTQKKKDNYYGCFWAYYMTAVLWNGDVVMCCRDYDGEYILGNIMDEKLQDIWNNERTRKLRNILNSGKNLPNPCAKCDKPFEPQFTLQQITKEVIEY